jgi:hypothetical protein
MDRLTSLQFANQDVMVEWMQCVAKEDQLVVAGFPSLTV